MASGSRVSGLCVVCLVQPATLPLLHLLQSLPSDLVGLYRADLESRRGTPALHL